MQRRRGFWIVAVCLSSAWLSTPARAAEAEPAAPPAAEIARMMREQPISRHTWPLWRDRYRQWCLDRSGEINAFEEALEDFVGQRAPPPGWALPPDLEADVTAHHLLGYWLTSGRLQRDEAQRQARTERAEKVFRHAIELDPKHPLGYAGLAMVLAQQMLDRSNPLPADEKQKRMTEARQCVARAVAASPRYRPVYLEGYLAIAGGDWKTGERLLRQALDENPRNEHRALALAGMMLSNPERTEDRAAATGPLVERFPQCGQLRLMHGVALLGDGKGSAAAEQFDQAKQLGTSLEETYGKEAAENIARQARLFIPAYAEGARALKAKNYSMAEKRFRDALQERPQEVEYARALAAALVSTARPAGAFKPIVAEIESLCQRFPEDGELATLLAVALADDGKWAKANEALDRAVALGFNPVKILDARAVEQIRKKAPLRLPALPRWTTTALYALAGVGVFYVAVILAMAAAGYVLSSKTNREQRYFHALQAAPGDLPRQLTSLQRPYLFALGLGLVLFHVFVPFVAAGVVAALGGLIYLAVQMEEAGPFLAIVVGGVGLVMVWAVLKSLLVRPDYSVFGIRKTADQCPRLYAALAEVAGRTEAAPLDAVYVVPGATIGVCQEGRGPLGLYGTRRRVLSLGLATLRYLSVSELKSLLAHEYAHFTNRDTYYTRWVQRVPAGIASTLGELQRRLGRMNWINPFYWCYYAYFRAYTMLLAGWSRTREYLADAAAAALYGRKTFLMGLTKVSTDGDLFEMTIYQNVQSLLSEGKGFVNMYEAFHDYRDSESNVEMRDKLYRALVEQKSTLFSTHPSFQDRFKAVSAYPDTPSQETEAAVTLFENPETIERELTEFLTHHVQYALASYRAARQRA